jgi:hypothetical protein
MTKGEIIESVLKEMRIASTHRRGRPNEEDTEEQDVIDHLENLLREAEREEDILTCTDLVDLKVECCPTCHNFLFPFFDMAPAVRLKSGRCAWVCCAVGSALKRTRGGEVPVKRPSSDQPSGSAEYKPFADFFDGKIEGNHAK